MKVTTKAPAPETETPTIDAAAEIKLLTPAVKEVFGALGAVNGKKVDLLVLILERIEENPDIDKATLRGIVQGAVAASVIDPKTKQPIKLAKVANSPKNGGDPSLYSFVSEIMTCAMPKAEFVEKVAKAIADDLGFEKIKFTARTGKPSPKKSKEKEEVPMTADAFLDAVQKLIEKCKLADISKATVRDSLDAAFEVAYTVEKA